MRADATECWTKDSWRGMHARRRIRSPGNYIDWDILDQRLQQRHVGRFFLLRVRR